jgi:hypothetical protein
MKRMAIGTALAAALLLSACTISSQYPGILDTTVAQALPHAADSTPPPK